MSIDPTLQAALGQSVVTPFCAVRFLLPGKTLRLLDGAGTVSFVVAGGMETFTGEDAEFGALGAVEQISGGEGDEAPELELTLYPPDATAAATLASPAMQGSEVAIFVGAIDPATGGVIGQPYLIFIGEIDVPTLTVSEGQRELTYSVVSVFERLFENEEGVRATDGWHQSIWPGERGLEFMTGTDSNLYWGATPPAGQTAKLPASRMSRQYYP